MVLFLFFFAVLFLNWIRSASVSSLSPAWVSSSLAEESVEEPEEDKESASF